MHDIFTSSLIYTPLHTFASIFSNAWFLCDKLDIRDEVLQTKGLKCLRPEEGISQNTMVFYDDKDSAEPMDKAEAHIRDDVISSALKVCPVQQCFVSSDNAA